MVNITWGDDIQPPIGGRYVLVNRNSGKVMEVANAATSDGASIRQGTPTGATHQQWDITPLDPRSGGDYSYFKITAVHSGKAPDVFNFSLSNGGNVAQWILGENGVGGDNQHWYLEYAGDGWFCICSKLSAKCLNVSDSSVADGANIVQWDNLAGAHQKWRLLPMGAPIEFVAPSAPTGLLASASARAVRVTWNARTEPDVASYTVFRSNTPGGPYDTIARDVSATTYVDSTAMTGGPYYYKVKAVDQSLNRSAYSGEASASPSG